MLKHAKAGNGAGVYEVVNSQLGVRYLSPEQKKVLSLASSFLYYLKNKDVDEIKLSWWANPEPGNFGDWLSPYIFHKITGKNIRFVNPESKSVADNHYFSVGSIGKFVKANSVVLGVNPFIWQQLSKLPLHLIDYIICFLRHDLRNPINRMLIDFLREFFYIST